jgi:hypothetical protein
VGTERVRLTDADARKILTLIVVQAIRDSSRGDADAQDFVAKHVPRLAQSLGVPARLSYMPAAVLHARVRRKGDPNGKQDGRCVEEDIAPRPRRKAPKASSGNGVKHEARRTADAWWRLQTGQVIRL